MFFYSHEQDFFQSNNNNNNHNNKNIDNIDNNKNLYSYIFD